MEHRANQLTEQRSQSSLAVTTRPNNICCFCHRSFSVLFLSEATRLSFARSLPKLGPRPPSNGGRSIYPEQIHCEIKTRRRPRTSSRQPRGGEAASSTSGTKSSSGRDDRVASARSCRKERTPALSHRSLPEGRGPRGGVIARGFNAIRSVAFRRGWG
jgi:hypothetical protein